MHHTHTITNARFVWVDDSRLSIVTKISVMILNKSDSHANGNYSPLRAAAE